MQPSFNIRSAGVDSSASHLMIEAGPSTFSYVIEDEQHNFSTVVTYSFPLGSTSNELAAVMEEIISSDPLLAVSYKKTDIVWTFPECLLVPHEWMNYESGRQMLDIVFGDKERGNFKSDFLFKHNMHAGYRIPTVVAEVFSRHFLYASQTHQYSILPDMWKNDPDQLFVIFKNARLTAMLHKGNKLHAVQSFKFQDTGAAVFHLLDMCRSFDASLNNVVLKCSGMIDENSPLYDALYKYFGHIQFMPLPADIEFDEGIKKYPPHFFSHLFATALCV